MKIELTTLNWTLEVESTVYIPLDNKTFLDYYNSLQRLWQASNLIEFKVTVNDNICNYSYKSVDSRKWKQTIDLTGSIPVMNFNCDSWKLSEFVPGRAVRDLTISLIKDFGATEIKMLGVV